MPGSPGFATVPLFGRGFTAKSPAVTDQLLINVYREPQGDPDKTSMALYGTPGLQYVTNFPLSGIPSVGWADLPIRGMRRVGNYIWFVVGSSTPNPITGGGFSAVLYMDGAGTIVVLGSSTAMLTKSGRVGMSDNGTQIIIVDGTAGYIIPINTLGAPTGAMTQIAAAGFPNGATTVDFLNGYFICDNPNATPQGRFNWSTQYDGTLWAALDFATAESNPDALIHIMVNFGQLFLFGNVTTEIWAPSGDTAIFRRVGAAGVEWGLAAKWTVDKYANNTLIFLGKNKLGQCQLGVLDGYTFKPITDPDVTKDINSRQVASATGFAYSLDSHTFYELNFPDKSYLYDDLSDSFSQLISNGGRHLGEMRAELNGVTYIADYAVGQVYRLRGDYYTDYNYPIINSIQTKHVFADYNPVAINELYVDCEFGDGLDGGVQGSNPQIMLQWSKDGGRTFGNEIWKTMGALGAYGARTWWQNLGIAKDWVFRFAVSDPVKLVITGAGVRVS